MEDKRLDISQILNSGGAAGQPATGPAAFNFQNPTTTPVVETPVVETPVTPTPAAAEVISPVKEEVQPAINPVLNLGTAGSSVPATLNIFAKVFGNAVKTVSIADKEAAAPLLEVFKASKGTVYRVGFFSQEFLSAWAHYHEKLRRFKCVEGICCFLTDDPRQYFGNLMIQYETNQNGDLIQPFSFKIKALIISAPGFMTLSTKNGQFPIDQYDYLLQLDPKADEQYQDLDYTPTSVCLWRQIMNSNPVAFQAIMAEVEKRVKYLPKKVWGKDLTEAEIKEAIGPTAAQQAANSTAGFDPTAIKI